MNLNLPTLPTWAWIAIGVLALAQVTIDVVALVVLVRTPRERLLFGLKWPWALIIVLINFIGAIVFLALGRRPAPVADTPAPGSPADTVARTVQSLYGDNAR